MSVQGGSGPCSIDNQIGKVVAIASLVERPAQSSQTPQLAPIHADVRRLERITVCTRPFRGEGPRIEAERFGSKLLVHNYGHGGSGWSLSWGSAAEVVRLVQPAGLQEVAVIGCGALGLTAAIALQRAGARVAIYARDLPAESRSARATGSWTPDARVALAGRVDPGFAARWERMARTSFAEYESLLALPGEPIKVQPRFFLSSQPPDEALARRFREDDLGFLHLEERLADLWPAPVDLPPASSPFEGLYSRQVMLFRFDIRAYSQHLLDEFHERGGVLRQTEFQSAAEWTRLPEPVLVNCTGYGARALLGDESLTPVRGQIGWLPAQPEVRYGVQWEKLNVVSRPDGMVVQFGAGGDNAGWNDASELPDRQESEDAVRMLARLQERLRR